MSSTTPDAAASGAAESGAPVRGSLAWVTFLVGAVIIVLDQSTKYFAVQYLEGQPPIQVVGDLLRLNFVRNPGGAFSLGGSFTILFSLVAIGIVAFVVVKARTIKSMGWAIAFGGVVGGAVGNLIDRIFRSPDVLRGHVVDFLQLPNWPIFNVADMAVVGSAILIVILVLRGIGLDGSRSGGSDRG